MKVRFICVVCQRCLYKKSVFCYDENKFKSQIQNFNLVMSFNGDLYICRTSCIKCQKGKVPFQAVSNKLEVFDLPVEFQSIQKLQKVFIAKCLLFKKTQSCQVARCQKYLEQHVMCQLIPLKFLVSLTSFCI